MKRFQQLLADAKPGPFEPVPDTRISAIAASLQERDIAEVAAELENLAREKAATPDWDGDTRDDIARAQHLFARLLVAVPAALQAQVTAALVNASGETLDWVKVARDEKV